MKPLLILLIIATCSHAFSDTESDTKTEKQKLVIPDYTSPLVAKNDNKIIKKLLIKVLTEQREFETTIMNKLQKTSKLVHLDLKLTRVDEGFVFKATTYIPNKQKKLRSLKTKPFKKNNLFRKVENTLRALFHLKVKVEEKEVEQKEANTFKKAEKAKKSLSPVSKTEKNKVNFRDRLLRIKSELPESLVKAKLQRAEDEKSEKEKSKNSASTSLKKKKKKKLGVNPKDKKSPQEPNWARKYHFSTGIKLIENDTTDFRNGRERLNLGSSLGVLNYSFGISLIPTKHDSNMFSFTFGINNPRKEGEYSFEPYSSYRLSYSLKTKYVSLSTGIDTDSIIAPGLSEQGIGLSAINISVTSLYLQLESTKLFQRIFIASGIKIPISYSILAGEDLSPAESAFTSYDISIKYDLGFLLGGFMPEIKFGNESYSSGTVYTSETTFVSLITNFSF